MLARVAHITDGRGSLDEYVTLWTEDCVWESPVAGRWEGHQGHHDRHARFGRAGIQGPGAETFHVLTTTTVDVDGDEATSMSTWLLVVDASTAPRILDIGTYRDRLRRSPTGWRIAHRVVSQGDGAWIRALDRP